MAVPKSSTESDLDFKIGRQRRSSNEKNSRKDELLLNTENKLGNELRSEEIDYNIQSVSNDKCFEKTEDAGASLEEDIINCDECEELFQTTYDLTTHVQSSHDSEKSCSYCSKPFKDTEKHSLTCSSCASIYYKKCTDFKSVSGRHRHWKPSIWLCPACKSKTNTSDDLVTDFSCLQIDDSELPTGLRTKNPPITGK